MLFLIFYELFKYFIYLSLFYILKPADKAIHRKKEAACFLCIFNKYISSRILFNLFYIDGCIGADKGANTACGAAFNAFGLHHGGAVNAGPCGPVNHLRGAFLYAQPAAFTEIGGNFKNSFGAFPFNFGKYFSQKHTLLNSSPGFRAFKHAFGCFPAQFQGLIIQFFQLRVPSNFVRQSFFQRLFYLLKANYLD